MKQLQVSDLYSLEEYHKVRSDFRTKVLQHKRNRQVALGPNATLYFEDRLTMQYQVQEMLRIERIFEAEAIEEELSAYNPLIPDGSNLKATFMIEFPDVEERRQKLQHLGGIEDQVYVQVRGFDRVLAHADEDLERSSDDGKTSAVHFVRFELTQEMIAALKQGAALGMGVTHPNYAQEIEAVDEGVRQSLVADLD
jgi:hypothetical protein